MQPRIPATIWALGLVSLCMDMSSEIIHALLPVFLVSTLGVSALTLGIIEGLAESTALILRVFSGAISDYWGRRKGLLLLGYGLAALSKPLFPLAHSAETVLAARLMDRVGKGIRGAPRDALVADVAPPEIRGACFGLRQSMDTIGAFAGPLLGIALMFWLADNIQQVLWWACLPALLAVLLIVAGVREPAGGERKPFRSPLRLGLLRRFSSRYWWIVAIGALFTLARFSEAFLVLLAQRHGLPLSWLPLVMVVMSLVYALTAYPVGVLADRCSKSMLLAIGLLILILADVMLALCGSIAATLAGIALWGLHLGFTQGLLATLVAEETPADMKGTAFGLFNLVSGLCLLLASVLAGWMWDRHGSASTFVAGGALAATALAATLLWHCRERRLASQTA